MTAGQSLMTRLRQSRTVGRRVINLPRMLRSPVGAPSEVILRGGNGLFVPKFQQAVTAIAAAYA